MKKTYEKPKLIALSLSGNNLLCGSCAGKVTLYDNSTLAQLVLMAAGRNSDYDKIEGISRGDFDGLFGAESECKGNDDNPLIKSYCKFTSSGEQITQVAWS